MRKFVRVLDNPLIPDIINKLPYYINTNEIPGEFSRENLISSQSSPPPCENNMLSSHVKISPLLWLDNKSLLSHQKLFK